MSLVKQDYKSLQRLFPSEVPKGMDAAANSLVGAFYRQNPRVWSLKSRAYAIHSRADSFRDYSRQEFNSYLQELRLRFRKNPQQDRHLVNEAFAALCEASERSLGIRPFPVQVMGALAMYNGYLIEMATGEGKTLTVCLPSVLVGWSARPCHVVTVNDYLASRDASSMSDLYRFCGLSVGCVVSEMEPGERRDNYQCAVVYATSKEILADYLRDRLKLQGKEKSCHMLLERLGNPGLERGEELVMRGLHTAFVDEVDSVLIDEAVTPLIISSPAQNSFLKDVVPCIQEISQNLIKDEDYSVDLKHMQVHLTAKGHRKIREYQERIPGIWQGASRREELIKQAISSREFYHQEKQYVVQDGKVIIVDEFTGRLMPNRSWSNGLHQMIEAKEGVEFSDPTETLARLSFQRFFRLFYRLGGMSGTAREAAGEFWQIFGLPTVSVPTHKPCIRRRYPDRFFVDAENKYQAIIEEILHVHGTGRPILVGTRSVNVSEDLAQRLAQEGLECQVLNAVRHEEEARIISQAGEYGNITIATNMAGRGTDIKLGPGVAEIGGLHVIATERHESGRIDRQLFGRCARQGDPGSTRAFVSLQDALFERFVHRSVRSSLAATIQAGLPGAVRAAKMACYLAQRSAQSQASQKRKSVLQNDQWFDKALSFSGKKSSL